MFYLFYILSFQFGSLTPLEPRLGKKLVEPLTSLIHSTTAMSLLYECISTVVTGIPGHGPSLQVCLYTRLSVFVVASFTIIIEAVKWREIRKAWQHSSHEWARGGREVHIGRKGPTFKYVCTILESTFATAKTNFDHTNIWSFDRQWSAANGQPSAVGPLPSPFPTSTLCLPDMVHMITAPCPSPFFTSFLLSCVCEPKQKGVKMDEVRGNDAMLVFDC